MTLHNRSTVRPYVPIVDRLYCIILKGVDAAVVTFGGLIDFAFFLAAIALTAIRATLRRAWKKMLENDH